MHLALYSVPGEAISELKEKFGTLPSEILVLDPEVSELNRLSFLDYKSASSEPAPSYVYLLAEYFTTKKIPNDDTFNRIQVFLERQFSARVQSVGQTYGRPMHMLDELELGKATSLIENYASEKGIQLPYIYYGPINMAKCAIVANDFSPLSLL